MIVKCQQCGLRDTDRKSMYKDKKGYYHLKCHETYLKEQERTKQDRKELDELTETLKRIHDMPVIPKTFYIRLADLRNGTAVRKVKGKGRREVKQRKGVTYGLINDTYKYSERKIMDAKRSKRFSSDTAELNYCLAIVIDNVNDVYKRQRNQKNAVATRDATQELQTHVERSNIIKYKPRVDKGDISEFLED